MKKGKGVLARFAYVLNNKHLPQKTKLLLYKVAIRPILLYGFPIWFSISPTVAKELEVLERKIIRKCINKNFINEHKRYSNTHIYTASNVVPLCEYAQRQQLTFVEKLATHENYLMNEIYEIEKEISWSQSSYLSSVGILNETLESLLDHNLPQFYKKIASGCHRG